MKSKKIDISIVIVNYKVKEYIANLLNSLKKAQADFNLEIFVVDNDSQDNSVDYLRARYKNVIYIENKENVLEILEDSGLGLPDYYKWRSRSGCTFCFFQRQIEWVGLKENHPEAFAYAKSLEKTA